MVSCAISIFTRLGRRIWSFNPRNIVSHYFFRVMGCVFLPTIFQLTSTNLKYRFPVLSIFLRKNNENFCFRPKITVIKTKTKKYWLLNIKFGVISKCKCSLVNECYCKHSIILLPVLNGSNKVEKTNSIVQYLGGDYFTWFLILIFSYRSTTMVASTIVIYT